MDDTSKTGLNRFSVQQATHVEEIPLRVEVCHVQFLAFLMVQISRDARSFVRQENVRSASFLDSQGRLRGIAGEMRARLFAIKRSGRSFASIGEDAERGIARIVERPIQLRLLGL